VNAQLESARATDVPSDHERRVTAFAEAMVADGDRVDEGDGTDGVDDTGE